MTTPANPFDSIVANLRKIHKATQQRATFKERNEDVDVVKYSGSYVDYYGDPIRLEVLYSEDQRDGSGTATFKHNDTSVKVKFHSNNGGVVRYKFVEGDDQSLLELLLALASDRQEM